MAVSTQSRKSGRTATQNSAETLESPSPREACLSVRLWSAPTGSEPAQSLWENDSPAACLTLDLIAASEGLPTARHGEVLVASFPTFTSAAMTARRLQWAVQGYAESEEPRTTSLALLIHSAEEGAAETVAEDAFHSLGQAQPGAILLTEKASQPFDRLPGFPLQVAAGDGLWELAWSSPEGHFSRSEDEQFLSQFAAENGVPEPPPEPPAPPAEAKEAFAEEYRTGSHRAGSYRQPSRQPSEDEPRSSSKMWIGGVALAVVVVIAIGIHLSSGKSSPAPVADQTVAQTQSASQADSSTPATKANSTEAVQPRHSAAQERADSAPAAKPPKNVPKPEAQQAQNPPPERERPTPKPAEPPAQKNNNGGGHCEYEQNQISGLTDQAWKKLGQGRYDAAKRQFIAVLACDPGNARAKEGLERARASAEAEGGSAN
jgi:hypothetical protein